MGPNLYYPFIYSVTQKAQTFSPATCSSSSRGTVRCSQSSQEGDNLSMLWLCPRASAWMEMPKTLQLKVAFCGRWFKLYWRWKLKIFLTGSSCLTFPANSLRVWCRAGLSGILPWYLIQLSNRLWSVDSSASFFTCVSKTYGCKFDAPTIKLIIDLGRSALMDTLMFEHGVCYGQTVHGLTTEQHCGSDQTGRLPQSCPSR